jgi:hypothetical protein
MANRCEPLLNVVRTSKPKGLSGLDQKVRGQAEVLPHCLPQMERHRRTGGAFLIQGTCTERGKPVSLPEGKASPQGAPMAVRVEDAGASECHSVMGWIGVAPDGHMTPRASGLTSHAGLVSREPLANRLRRQSR